jgi:transcriptional regulator with XRE-family HTH domain
MLQERLKKAREEKSLTQTEVAKEIGISQPAYSDIERGDRMPSLAVTKRLASLLDCSIDYLVGEQ